MRRLAALLVALAASSARAEAPLGVEPRVEPSPAAATEAPPSETGVIGKASGKGLGLSGAVDGSRASADAATSWSKMLLPLALTGLLLGAGVLVLKRVFPSRTGGKPSALMEVLARTPVGPKQSVVLLRVAGRVIVVGVSPESMATLTEIRDEQEVEKILLKELRPASEGFKTRLAGVLAPFRPAPIGAFGKDEGAGELEGEIRSLERRVASWRLEERVEGGERGAGV